MFNKTINTMQHKEASTAVMLPFTKMQGLGNDYVYMEELEAPLQNAPELARKISRRHFGVGSDGLVLIGHSEIADFRMRIFNADGSEAEMCGNGARCLARYAYENGIAGENMVFETVAGPVEAWRRSEREYKIKLNSPGIFTPDVKACVGDKTYDCTYVELGSPGIPHGVVNLPNFRELPEEEFKEIGKALRYHEVFPKGANINFYDIAPDGEIYLSTYERGVEDFTLACGTGSGSTALTLQHKKEVEDSLIKLNVPGGILSVEIVQNGDDVDLYLIGDTNIVAKGTLTDEDIF